MTILARLLEAADATGASWRVLVIQAGLSLNGRRYLESDLRAEAAAFENRPIKAFPVVDAAGNVLGRDHLRPDAMVGRASGNTIGVLRDVRWSEAHSGLVGTAHLLDTPLGNDYGRLFRALEAKGALGMIGFSIDVLGRSRADGSKVPEVVNSLDVVDNPAAGGRMLERIVASLGYGAPTVKYKTILAALAALSPLLAQDFKGDAKDERALGVHALKRAKESKEAAEELAKLIAPKDADTAPFVKRLTEATDAAALVADCMDLVVRLRESVEVESPAAAPAAPPPAPQDQDARLRALESREFASHLREAGTAAKLGTKVIDGLVASHKGETGDAASAQRIVESYRKVIDAALAGSTDLIRVVREPRDRYTEALAHQMAPLSQPKPAEGIPLSMRNPLRMIESMLPNGMRIQEIVAGGGRAARMRLKEAVDATNFDDIFDDTLDRVILPEYKGQADFQNWRKLVAMRPYNDFRTHRLITIGYYANLSTVAKGAPYLAMTTPSDREETIALAKKGGLETITMEDMLNDDTGELWPTMIKRILRAALETRSEGVFSKLRIATQPTMSDSYALTSASRSPANLLTTALTADATGKTALLTAIRQMMAGTGGSGTKKGVRPKSLVIPLEKLEAAAYVLSELTAGNTGTDVPAALKEVLGLSLPEVVIDWGATNLTDWFLAANPAEVPGLFMANLGGREGPEIFLADDQRFSSLFTNDVLELKVRDIWACAAGDFLAFQGNDAAT